MVILSTPSVQVASRRIRMHYTNCSVAVGRQTLSSTAPQRPISKPVSRCENSRNHRGSRTPTSRHRARRGCGGWRDGPGSCPEHALPCHPMVPAYKRMEGGPCLPRSGGTRVVGQDRRPASTSPVAIRTVINMVPVRDSTASGCHPRTNTSRLRELERGFAGNEEIRECGPREAVCPGDGVAARAARVSGLVRAGETVRCPKTPRPLSCRGDPPTRSHLPALVLENSISRRPMGH